MMEEIKCPKCGTKIEDESLYQNHVTYWGEDGPKEYWCDCDYRFMIKEYVSRWFEISEIGQ